jgi:maltose O-acetyltransferase
MMPRQSNFLKTKFVGVSPKQLVCEQFESAVVGLTSWVPTIIGMFIRNIAYRVLGMKMKGFCWIQPRVTIVNMRRLSVGRNFGCNSGTYINAIGFISMGDDVLIGSNVTISSGKHEIEGRERSVFSRPVQPMQIAIGDDVWIGAGASVLPGVRVAEGTVIGANAVVTKSTEPFSVMVGVPARVIRFR